MWNPDLAGYVCYFQEDSAPSMAFTSDSTGATGWKKWYNGKFDSSQPGSGGLRSDMPGLSGNGGANFSVHWNTYLLQWVMVWQKWGAGLSIAQSLDGIHWTSPRTLFLPAVGRMTWYPTIIGPEGDLKVGSTAVLYYTDMNSSYGDRKAMYRSITFSRTD